MIDAGNYYPDRDRHVTELDRDQTTSTELLSTHLAGATVVKSFNTMYYSTLARSGRPDAAVDDRLALFVSGDDQEAKRIVAELIDELGFAAIDTGGLVVLC